MGGSFRAVTTALRPSAGEFTMIELAEMVKKVVNPNAEVSSAPGTCPRRQRCAGTAVCHSVQAGRQG